MKVFASDLGFPEAPVQLPDGGWLVVEMNPDRGCITRLSADGLTRERIVRTGRPNGLARDRNGAIWVAETHQRALLKLSLDGSYVLHADRCRGERFLFFHRVLFQYLQILLGGCELIGHETPVARHQFIQSTNWMRARPSDNGAARRSGAGKRPHSRPLAMFGQHRRRLTRVKTGQPTAQIRSSGPCP